MSIILLVGRPRQGKGMVAAALAEEAMRLKRLVVADYWMDGALPLYAYTDISSPHYAGALFIFDEAGSTFAARDTFSLDPLVFAAATMHGHIGADVVLQGQSVMFIDIQWRRLAAEVIVVSRVGPDGKNVISRVHSGEKRIVNGKIKDEPVPFIRRPWFFIARYYYITDFHLDSGELKATARPHRMRIFAWTRKRARMYNTQQLLVPEYLSEAWEQSVADSWHRRYEVPFMKKGQVVSPMDLSHVPPPTLVNRDGTPLKAQPSIESINTGRGYFTDGNDWHTNDSLHVPPTTDTIRKVGKLPFMIESEVLPNGSERDSSNGRGNTHDNGESGKATTRHGNGNSRPDRDRSDHRDSGLTRYRGGVRRPGDATRPVDTGTEAQPSCGDAGQDSLNPSGHDAES